MPKWQGIVWRRDSWKEKEWNLLAQLLNSKKGFGWLRIQYPFVHCDPETGHWCEIPKNSRTSVHWHERALVQRVVYHEGLFSIFFSWQAGFSEARKSWIWIYPPNASKEPVNANDFNTLADDYDDLYQPEVVRTSHGNLLRLGEDTIAFPERRYHVDPLEDVKNKGSLDGLVYGGLFLLPPEYKAKLLPEQIKKA